jgi:hypothetical protein
LEPPVAYRWGGFPPAIFRPTLVCASDVLDLSANVRTPVNSPCVGLKFHFSSGIASAKAMKSCSMSFQTKLMEPATVLRSGGRCCAIACAEFANSKVICGGATTIDRFGRSLKHLVDSQRLGRPGVMPRVGMVGLFVFLVFSGSVWELAES